MSSTNLNLEEIILDDTLNGTMLEKLNENMKKLDDKYGELKNALLEQTGKSTLAEAVEYVQSLYNQIIELNTIGTATASDILSGKVALVKGELVTGVGKIRPTINITLDSSSSSTYAGYISGYGAGIDDEGTLIIWAMSNTSSYEHINFVDTSIGIGTIGEGWNITSYDTSDPVSVPHACTVVDLSNDLSNYNTINITLKPTAVNSSYDYITVQVTVTGS